MGRSSGRSQQYGCGTQCIRCLFIGCSAFFMVLGVIEFAFGVRGVVVSDGREDVITGSSNLTSSTFLLVGGFIVFSVSFVGLLGAIFMSPVLLIAYAIIIGLLILLQLIGAILSFIYANEIRSSIEDRMESALEDYRIRTNISMHDDDVNDAVENVQKTYKCCGIDNSTDWVTLNPDAVVANGGVPPANCQCNSNKTDDCVQFLYSGQTEKKFVQKDGCLTELVNSIELYAVGNGVIIIIVLITELFFMAISIGLTWRVFEALRDRDHDVLSEQWGRD